MHTPQFPNNIISRETWEYRLASSGLNVASGVKYHWELAGGRGGDYFLLREPHHTDEQIDDAAELLRRQHDVCALYFVDVANCVPPHKGAQWEVGYDCGDGTPIITFEARDIARLETYYKDADANAKRIVDCVNACEGIEDPLTTLPAMAEALRRCLFYTEQMAKIAGGDGEKSAAMAQAVLAKFKALNNSESEDEVQQPKGRKL